MRMISLARAGIDRISDLRIAVDHELGRRLVARNGFAPALLHDGHRTGLGYWEAWDETERIDLSLRADRNLLRAVRPDVVVHDGRPTTPIVARELGIRCAAVLQSIHWAEHCYEGRGREAIWSEAAPAFSAPLASAGFDRATPDLRDVMGAQPSYIPSFPPFDALRGVVPDDRYIGPLTGVNARPHESPRPRRPPTGILLYGVLSREADLEAFRAAFDSFPSPVRIATGNDDDAQLLTNRLDLKSYEVRALWEASELARSTVLVIHGGHGITLTALQLGIPAVALPGASPERKENARHIERMGAGISIDEGSELSWGEHDSRQIKVDWTRVRAAVEDVLHDNRYREAASYWSAALRRYSTRDAFDRIMEEAAIPALTSIPERKR